MTKESNENDSDQVQPTSKGCLRRLLIVAGCALAVLILCVVALPLLSPLYSPFILNAISDTTGLKTTAEKVSVNVLTSRANVRGLRIFEENGATELAAIDELMADFKIFPLLSGKIHAPSIRIKGVRARVEIDKNGKANYSPLIEHLQGPSPSGSDTQSNRQKSKQAHQEKAVALPDVKANLQIDGAQLSYNNLQTRKKASIKIAHAESHVRGLDDISYNSSGTARLQMGPKQKQTLSSKWSVTGRLGLKDARSALKLAADGEIAVNELHVGTDKNNGPTYQLKASHDLSYIPDKNFHVSSFVIDSDMFDLHTENLKCGDPMVLTTLFNDTAKANSFVPSRKLSGHITGNIHLAPILQLTNQLEWTSASCESNNPIAYDLRLQGEIPADIQTAASVSSEGIHIRRSSPEAQISGPLKLQVSSFTYEVQNKLNLRRLRCKGTHTLNISGHNPKANLLTLDQIWDVGGSQTGSKKQFSLRAFESDISLNLAELTKTIKGVFPQTTRVSGSLTNHDTVRRSKHGLDLQGKTALRGHISTPKAESNIPLNIEGQRDLEVSFTDNNQLKTINVKHLNLESLQSDLFALQADGQINLSGADKSQFKAFANVNLDRTKPYMKAFGLQYDLNGSLKQKLSIDTHPSSLTLDSSGELRDFVLKRPSSSTPIKMGTAGWEIHVDGTLDNGTWDRLVFSPSDDRPCEFRIPGMRAELSGRAFRGQKDEVYCRLEQFEGSVSGDVEQLPAGLRAFLPNRYTEMTGRLPYQQTIQLNGPLNKLSVRHSFDATPHFIPSTDNENAAAETLTLPVNGRSRLSVTGLTQFLRANKNGILRVHFANAPRSTVYRIGKPDSPAVTFEPAGDLVVSKNSLRFSEFKVRSQLQAHPLQQQVLAPLQKLSGWHIHDIHLKGSGDAQISLNGSLSKGFKGDAQIDLSEIAANASSKQGQDLLSKNSSTSCAASGSYTLEPTNSGWKASLQSAQATFADLKATGDGTVGFESKTSLPSVALSAKVKSPNLQSVWDTIPAVRPLKLQGGNVDVTASEIKFEPEQPLQVDVSGTAHIDSFSLVNLPKLLNRFTPTARKKTAGAHSTAGPPSERSSKKVPVSQEPNALEHLRCDLRGSIDQFQIGPADTISSFTLGLNSNLQNAGRLAAKVSGVVNAGNEKEKGALDITCDAHMDGDIPRFRSEYHLQQFPITQPMLETARFFALFGTQMELFDSVTFKSTEDFVVSTQGQLSWRGMKWPQIQRSLASPHPAPLDLPGGRIGITVDLKKVLQSDTTQKLIQNYLSVITGDLEKNVERKKKLTKRIQKLKDTLNKLRETAEKAEKQKKRIKNVIDKLRPLAMFSEDAEEKLDKFEQKLDKYTQDLKEERKKLDSMLERKENLNQKRSKLDSEIDTMRKRVKKRDSALSGLGLDTDLSFSFNAAHIKLLIANSSPWKGKASQEKLREHPVTQIQLKDLYFLPKGKDYPRVTGYLALNGNYQITFRPSMDMLDDLREDIPQIARYLHKNGLTWTPDGLQVINR